ncbi:hypothetical protein ACFV3E_24645 [Streptomyces sp. NPDC059718]
MHTLAASANGAAFGALGAGGIALASTFALVLGVRGKGRVKLKENPAVIVGFLAGTAFIAAGNLFAKPQQFTAQGLTGLGVGTGGDGIFGNVGVGAVCLILLILMLMAKLTPAYGAILGIIAACVWPTAGDGTIWAAPTEMAAGVLMMLGS